MLNQGERAPLSVELQVAQVFAATNGNLDRVNVDRVVEFNEQLPSRLKSESGDLLEKIAGGDWSDETQSALKDQIKDFADDFGYDLDEEGEATDDGGSDRVSERKKAGEDDEAKDSSEDDAKDGADETEEAVTA